MVDFDRENTPSKEDILFSKSIKLLVLGILIGVMLTVIFSCSPTKVAAGNTGMVVDTSIKQGNQYANILFVNEEGKADYSFLIPFYLPYPVNKKEEVVIVTRRYLDSLISVKN